MIVDVIVHHQSRKYQQLQWVVRNKSSGRESRLGGLIGRVRHSQRMRRPVMGNVCSLPTCGSRAALPSRRHEQTGTATGDGVGANAPTSSGGKRDG